MLIAASHDFIEFSNLSLTPFPVKRGDHFNIQGIAKISIRFVLVCNVMLIVLFRKNNILEHAELQSDAPIQKLCQHNLH